MVEWGRIMPRRPSERREDEVGKNGRGDLRPMKGKETYCLDRVLVSDRKYNIHQSNCQLCRCILRYKFDDTILRIKVKQRLRSSSDIL